MKSIILAAIVLASFGASAKLSSIVEVTNLTCQEAIHAVKRNGFLYLTVNGKPKLPHLISYYPDDRQCSQGEQAVQAWLPTADAKNCPVAFVCVEKRQNP